MTHKADEQNMATQSNPELHEQSEQVKSVHEAPSKRYVWYSICSAHQSIDDQCVACHSGTWVDDNDPEVIADHQLYKDDPELWIDKHNPCACLTCSGYCTCGKLGHHRWEANKEA